MKEPVEGGHPSEILTGFVASALALAIAFNVPVTEPQVIAIIGFVGWLPSVITLINKARVQKAEARAWKTPEAPAIPLPPHV